MYTQYIFLLFCKLISVIDLVVNNNEPCRPKLHSLVVRLVSYISAAARGEWCGNAMERRSGNIVGFVAAAVSMPMGGCRAIRPVVDMSVTVEPAVL